MFVCLCKSVTDHQIRDAVDEGVCTFDGMQKSLQVATACGGCTCEVKKILQKKLEQEVRSRAVQTGYPVTALVTA